MSEPSPKRQKTTATASEEGVPAFDKLPPELQEAIFGFLDVRTLCTARLVCAHFLRVASRCVHSVELSVETLRTRPETTLNNFPNLTRVTVFEVEEVDLAILANSALADAVTHLRADENLGLVPGRARTATGSPLLLFPNLMSLTVGPAANHVSPFPQTLRELTLGRSVTQPTANLVAALTNLTCLRINTSGMRKPFEAVTALTALQRLDITCELPLIPSVAELTLLTHLQLRGTSKPPHIPAQGPESAVVSLTRLHRLVHLGVLHGMTWESNLERVVLASIGTLTSLRSLDVWLGNWPLGSAFTTFWATPFPEVTSLRVGRYGMDASFSPRFDVGRLQDLSLAHGVGLHHEGLPALRQATSLTRLDLWWVSFIVRPEELGTALACMPRLRALSFGAGDQFPASFCIKAVGLPTQLTRLELSGRCVATNADMEVFLGLKKLRVLSMQVRYDFRGVPSLRIKPETVFAVAKLPELCKLEIISMFSIMGEACTDDVWELLNAERRAKGWPALEMCNMEP